MPAIFSASEVRSPFRRDADHRHPPVPELQRIGDGDDLHHAHLEQALHTLAHRGLRQAHGSAQPGVGRAPIGLEVLDDGPVDRVESGPRIARFSARQDVLIITCFSSVYASIAYTDMSLPTPDCLKPPWGISETSGP